MNGYTVRKSDMGSRQPYYNQFPTRDERKQAREEGITMSNFGALKYKPKKIDKNDPFNITYEIDPYDDPTYLKQLLTHRAPRVPTTRSPYQVFTGFISKSIWDNFKFWLGNPDNKKVFNEYMKNTGTKEEPKYEFVNLKQARLYLAAEDMLSYSAYAYEKYVKDPVFSKSFNNDAIFQKALSKIQLQHANAVAKYEANQSESNLKKLTKYNEILSDQTKLANEIVSIITKSAAFKEACENLVKQMISDENRRNFLNTLFKELTDAQYKNEKLCKEAEDTKQEVDLTKIIKLQTMAQLQKSKIKHRALNANEDEE